MNADNTEREWVSFEGPDADGDPVTWMFDATFLTSNYSCIYGRGCRGIRDTDTTHLEEGCCSHGAHLVGPEDAKAVKDAAKRLTPDDWQHIATAQHIGDGKVHRGIIETNDEGELVTRTIDDACIFLNRPDFEGGAGCALHRAALRVGERPLDWKPDVCWQVPLRLDYLTDTRGMETRTLTDWKRRDWGDGGADFHWWCTESDEAYVGHKPVWVDLRDEIVELVGVDAYEQLAEILEQWESPVTIRLT